MKLTELRTPFNELSVEQKLALLEEIRARRVPIIKVSTSKSKTKSKEVKPRLLRKAKSLDEILKYMNERIINMESPSHD